MDLVDIAGSYALAGPVLYQSAWEHDTDGMMSGGASVKIRDAGNTPSSIGAPTKRLGQHHRTMINGLSTCAQNAQQAISRA
jgi:hypothetical protein